MPCMRYCFAFVTGVSIVSLLGLFLDPAVLFPPRNTRGDDLPIVDSTAPFSWRKITPQHTLDWHLCYEEYQCARLIVPLDHANPDGRQATIALIRLPAECSAESDEYRGPILFNPGGPGAGGIDQILNRGKLFRSIVGPQFDLVGFDPRGLGASTPVITFFKTDAQRALWAMGNGAPNTTDQGLAESSARAFVLGKLAAQNDDGSLQYMNTEQTARDMMKIVEAYGQTKLQYWGFSYGTVLGVTFAVLFPDKIERLLLDGVSDAYNYYGVEWSNTLQDTAKVSDLFVFECHQAGSEACAFWEPTVVQTAQKLERLFDTLHKKPVAVFNSETDYGIIDRDAIRMVMFKLLKGPYSWSQPMAQGLQDLENGDGTWALEMFKRLVRGDFECPSCDSTEPEDREVLDDGGSAILCNDYPQIDDAETWAEEYYAKMMNGSKWGDIWSRYLLYCQHWPKYPKSTARGPFNAKTSHPILFLANTIDPVTPLFGAYKMSSGFPGSAILLQEAAGHASLVASSPCTHAYIKQYFTEGTLPEPGTKCQVDASFFPKTSALASGEHQSQFYFSP